jgi:hypothetical protein
MTFRYTIKLQLAQYITHYKIKKLQNFLLCPKHLYFGLLSYVASFEISFSVCSV